MTTPTETQVWTGPARFLPPPEPLRKADGVLHFSGVTYAVPGGYRPLQLDVLVPAAESPAPLVIWIHGGAWMMGDRRYLPETLRPNQIFDELLAAGLSVATIDLEDGLGVVGQSSAVDVVVDWYGVSDLSTMPRMTPPPQVAAMLPPELQMAPEDVLLAGLDETGRADASPVTHVTAGAPPFLLVHGTADGVVPFAQSESLAAVLTRAGVEARLLPVPEADHIFLGCRDIDAIVRLSVDHLADALLEKNSHV